jgi:hypothetical protein
MEQSPSSKVNIQLVKFPTEQEDSLPCSQKHATDPYPEPNLSSQHLPTRIMYNF